MNELLRGLTSADLRSNPDFYQVKPSGEMLRMIEASLTETLFGQERAVRDTARAMLRSLGGCADPHRPELSILVVGPPGTGKTELARAISRYCKGKDDKERLLIIDGADFQSDFDIHKITGSNPGYVGYGDQPLISPDHLSRKNVICFDEIEKASVSLHRLLLGILDRGKMTVPIGEATYRNVQNTELNFANSTIVLTSNVGSEQMAAFREGKGRVGFQVREEEPNSVYSIGLKAVKDRFKHIPELLNRLDAIVVFNELTPEVFTHILDKFIDQFNNDQTHPNFLALTTEAKRWILSKVDHKQGGRVLKRAIEKHITTPFAEVKLEAPQGVPFIADLDDKEQLIFWTAKTLQKADKPENEPIEVVDDWKTE